ncbi:hypothetical protein CEK26_000921 [Fusarium fujikuroi]|nr:hypothetical protein CEK27_000921 [Fusarium fujikuroi]QGI76013.1 hypothetical protein CEK25_000919 [Fusarium fujikuroi]QGI89706.1 hypothetical protein CEK26_000921 [Fusarium fujikuroi]
MPLLSYLYSWVKPRQCQREERSPSFSLGKKKRTKSGLDKNEKEDFQRSNIIRKSLQSRASSRATVRQEDENDTEEEDRNTTKQINADEKTPGSRSLENTNSRRILLIPTSTTIFLIKLNQRLLSAFTDDINFNKPSFARHRESILIRRA